MRPALLIAAIAGALASVACLAGQAAAADDTRIVLDNLGCMGCPAYTVTLTGDGGVTYDGIRHVGTFGRRTRRVDASAVEALATSFVDRGFMAMRDQYVDADDGCDPAIAMDSYNAALTLSRGGVEKSVRFYYGCRGLDAMKRLARLAADVQALAGATQWADVRPEDRALWGAVEIVSGGCERTGCDDATTQVVRDVRLIASEQDVDVVLCRDGFLHVSDTTLPFVSRGGIQTTLDASAVRAIDRAISEVHPSDWPFDLAITGWPGTHAPTIFVSNGDRVRSLEDRTKGRDLPATAAGLLRELRRLLPDKVLVGREHDIRPVVVPAGPRVRDADVRPWPAEHVLPAASVGTRRLTADEWARFRATLGRTTPYYDGPYHFAGRPFGHDGPVELVLLVGADRPRRSCIE